MALNTTLAAMITAVRIKADNRRNTDTEIYPLLNKGMTLLHQMLTEAYDDYHLKSFTFPTADNTAAYDIMTALATDFYKLRGLEIQDGSRWVPLDEYLWVDRNSYTNNFGVVANYAGPFFWYRLEDKNIRLAPIPGGIHTLQAWYTPVAQQWASEVDAATYDTIDGFDEYPINYAAIQLLIGEESDTTPLERQQQMMEQKIEKAIAARRNTGAPRIVAAASGSSDRGRQIVPGRWL